MPKQTTSIPIPRRVTIPIRPLLGYWSFDAGRDIPLGASPEVVNCIVERGFLKKRPGYEKFPSDHEGFGEPVVGLYATQDANRVQYLYATTPTKLYRYDDAAEEWDEITGAGLTGSSEDLFSFENSQNKVVMSQGVDKVQVFDYGGATYAGLNTNAVAAKYLVRYGGRLNLGSTVESSVAYPYRHRRPVRDDHTDWTGLGSGFRDQGEFPYHLQGMKKLQTQLILYYEQAIEACIQQANASAPFRYEWRATDIGLYAPRTLVGRNAQHFFLGGDDFYSFNGLDPQSIGLQVRDDVFRALNPSALSQCFGELIPGLQLYAAFLVTGGSSYADVVYVYSWLRGIWMKWGSEGHRCSTIYRLDDGTTIDELEGTIDEQMWAPHSAFTLRSYPGLYTGHNDGYVHRWSQELTSDDGAAISCMWTSQDFTAEKIFDAPGRKITVERIDVEYEGVDAEFSLMFSFSTDGGFSWSTPVEYTAAAYSSGLHTFSVTRRTTGDRVRFRFTHASATETFCISKFEVECTLHESQEYAA